MLRRVAQAFKLPITLDSQDAVLVLRRPNADDLAVLPASIRSGLGAEVASRRVPETPTPAQTLGLQAPAPSPSSDGGGLDKLVSQAGAAITRNTATPEALVKTAGLFLGKLTEMGAQSAEAEEEAARAILLRCGVGQLNDDGAEVPFRFVATEAEEAVNPLGLYWSGGIPLLRGLWAPIKEAIVGGIPTFRP